MKKIIKQIAGKEGARPVTSILNQKFQYRPSHQTSVAETFARLRAQSVIVLPANVEPLKKARA